MSPSETTEIEHVAQSSESSIETLVEELRRVAPGFFSDGSIDLERVNEVLGAIGEERSERYHFSWAGRRAAIDLLKMGTRGTLSSDGDLSAVASTRHLFVGGDNLEVMKLLLDLTP